MLWHDYETFGADPMRDRPAQFACWRTDLDLNPIDEPRSYFCQPPPDYLPDPEACLLTGLLPDALQRTGLPEPAFVRAVQDEFVVAATCGVGYNSIRFDDELTRHLFWRNLLDPYAREWAHGNSRWDLIDVLRMAYALRPGGMQWPQRDDGSPSFKLEHLAQANAVAQSKAHDAVDDVSALIGLARRFRAAQPRLYQHAFALRDKTHAARWIQLAQPVVHVSQRFAADRGCLALVLPLARHPVIHQRVIVADLGKACEPWLELSAESLAQALIAPRAENVERPPLKLVHLNRAPMLAPLSVLQGVDTQRIKLDVPACLERAEQLKRVLQLPERLRQTWRLLEAPAQARDPEQALYDGFVPDQDRLQLLRLASMDWQDALCAPLTVQDQRLPTLQMRARARWLPESLDPEQIQRWQADASARLLSGPRSYVWFRARCQTLRDGGGDAALLARIEQWGAAVMARFGIDTPPATPAARS